MMKTTIFAAIAAIGLGTAAQAATFEYGFTATQTDAFLTDGSTSVARQAAALQTITGIITLSDEVIFQSPSSQVIHFAAPTILVDGLDLTGVIQPFSIRVENDDPDLGDTIGLDAFSDEPLSSTISLVFFLGEVFDEPIFPGPDIFRDFFAGTSSATLNIVTKGPDFDSRVEIAEFHLTSMKPNFVTDPAPVPLPASALMFLAAIAGIGAMRGRPSKADIHSPTRESP